MVSYYTRKYGGDGALMISLRIRTSEYDKHFALGVSVDSYRWQAINATLKNAMTAYKRGTSIFIEDALATKLWQLQKELIALQKGRMLTESMVHQLMGQLLHDDTPVLNEIQQQAVTSAKPTFLEFVAQYIEECESGERLKMKSTRKITAGTIKNYKGFLAQMKEYEKSRKRIVDWDDLSFDFYRDYKQFFIEKQYSPNTIARHVKTMKTMLYAAKDLHLTTRDDFTSKQWSADKEEVDNVYIPVERLREMYDFDMSDYKAMKQRVEQYGKDTVEKKTVIHALKRDIYRQRLSEARDIFLMGCLTGQRVSDYKRISRDMIETIQGDRKFLHLVQVKTDKDVYVPYNDMMQAILDKYDGQLPKIYDQDLNERIKVVGLLLGWTESAGLTERKGVMEYESKKRFCDALATHTARRTFATNAYKAGVPLSAIMAVTGHASEEMLRRYLKLNTKERALLAAAEFDKVKEVKLKIAE
jgi:integrase